METTLRPPENGWLPDTPIEDSVLRRFVFNQAQLNELVAEHAAGRSDRTAAISLADAQSPVAYFNQAVLLQPLLDADDPTLNVIENFTDASTHSSTLLSAWPTPDLQPRGWDLVGHPMLVLRSPGPTPIVDTHGVQVEFARSADELAAAAQVAIDGYPFEEPGLEAGDLFPAEAVRHGLTVRVALVGDEPAAVGYSFVANGVVNLCLPRRCRPLGDGESGASSSGSESPRPPNSRHWRSPATTPDPASSAWASSRSADSPSGPDPGKP